MPSANRFSCLTLCAFRFAAVLGFFLTTTNAHAACGVAQPPPEFYVGDTASDAACTHNDLQSALDAATCAYGTKIFVTREHTYTTQHLTLADKKVHLIARGDGVGCGHIDPPICEPPFCPPPITGPLVTLGGHNGDSVVSISGNSIVTLTYFDINNGVAAAGGAGGGISFIGSGSLVIETSWVRANHATDGGGIYFQGTGSTMSTLTVSANTQVLANTADGMGGGILVKGNATLNVLEPQTVIQSNHADSGYGGGVAVIGPARANIGSPGIVGDTNVIGVLNGNSAEYGGGMALVAGTNDGDYPLARLFTTDASLPVAITNNTASHTGGGIYMKPYLSAIPYASNSAYLCAWDFRIAGNIAQEGTAIYSDTDSGGVNSTGGITQLGNCDFNGETFPTALGAVPCTDSAACNTIEDNDGTDPTQGSVILVQTEGAIVANRFSMRNNHSAHAIRVLDNTLAYLSDCLIAGNTWEQEPIHSGGNNISLKFQACTFADDLIGASHVIHSESDLTMDDTLIQEPGTLALDYSGNPANLIVHYVISNDTTTLPVATGVVQGSVQFVDAAGGDYHLKPGQLLGIDFAPEPTGLDQTGGVDLDGRARSIDLPTVVNAYGARDVGAYEAPNLFRDCGAVDSVYCDGFDH